MPKIAQQSDGRYIFECPGCGCAHWFQVEPKKPAWTWNGDVEKPTISPSILVNGYEHGRIPPAIRCHSYVTNGRIEFLSDSDHALSGQTVDLPDL